MKKRSKIRQIYLILLLISMFLLIGTFVIAKNTKDIEVIDPEAQKVIQNAKEFWVYMDRCDPLRCNDHFQITKIEKLHESVTLTNTGAAKVGTHPSVGGGPIILESYKKLNFDYQDWYKQETCLKGNYILHIVHRNWIDIPEDTIKMRYSLNSRSSS